MIKLIEILETLRVKNIDSGAIYQVKNFNPEKHTSVSWKSGEQEASNEERDKQSYNKLIKNNAKSLKKIGIILPETPKSLGAGSWGTAFDIGNGKVLKITKDSTEATTSAYVKNKKLKYVNQINNIFRKGKDYFIVQKKLNPFPKKYEKIWEESGWAMRFGTFKGKLPNNKYKEMLKDFKKLVSDKDAVKVAKFIKGAVDELIDNKIEYNDMHPGNIMVDENGDFKIIDLGESESPAKVKITKIGDDK